MVLYETYYFPVFIGSLGLHFDLFYAYKQTILILGFEKHIRGDLGLSKVENVKGTLDVISVY